MDEDLDFAGALARAVHYVELAAEFRHGPEDVQAQLEPELRALRRYIEIYEAEDWDLMKHRPLTTKRLNQLKEAGAKGGKNNKPNKVRQAKNNIQAYHARVRERKEDVRRRHELKLRLDAEPLEVIVGQETINLDIFDLADLQFDDTTWPQVNNGQAIRRLLDACPSVRKAGTGGSSAGEIRYTIPKGRQRFKTELVAALKGLHPEWWK